MPSDTILIGLVLIAGFYMAWNIGANDVANAMGTSVGSGALTLRQAVIVAAFLEFIGAFFFGRNVSETVQRGIVNVDIFVAEPYLLVYGMLASLIAAGVWLQIASYNGWPVSTTHTIVGSIVGFGVICGGVEAIQWESVGFIVSSWLLSPLIGGALSFLIFTFLRKTIFYTEDPLASSKRIAPLLVFAIVLVLSLVLILNGLENLHLNLNTWQVVIITVTLSSAASLVSGFLVKKVGTNLPPQTKEKTNESVALLNIEKAKRHLFSARAAFPEDTQGDFSSIIEQIEKFKRGLRKTKNLDPSHLEYVAVERIFGYLQIMSACLMAFAHGANDVANAIGPLAAALDVLRTGKIAVEAAIPAWILALGGVGIVIGLATWGWRVIETIGKKITELTPTRGFAAEFATATTILMASAFGMPVSTTHTLVGAVLGVGMARGMEALNLAMARDIFISWAVTVPAGAAITVVFFSFFRFIFG